MTQKQQIMKVLKAGVELTSLDGLKLGIVRVTNRVNELRASGVPIRDRWEVSKQNARYKVYFLK
jgi:hypothetical protein